MLYDLEKNLEILITSRTYFLAVGAQSVDHSQVYKGSGIPIFSKNYLKGAIMNEEIDKSYTFSFYSLYI